MSKSKASSLPEGIHLDASQKYSIGPMIGQGACGSVHSLFKNSSPVPFVIKLAPLPPNHNTSTNKKKKKTQIERNASTIYYEHRLYKVVFCDLLGDLLADVPVKGPQYGDLKEGFRYMVLEEMKSPITSIIPILYSSLQKTSTKKKSSTTTYHIPLGHIATRLLSIIEAIHSYQYVCVDVKTDNFMIANYAKTGKHQSKPTDEIIQSHSDNIIELEKSLSKTIRMIDLGLVESYKDPMTNKHRPNTYPNGNVIGTPLYVSDHLFEGHLVSRRDDLESLGYVLLELILYTLKYHESQVNHRTNKHDAKKRKSSSSSRSTRSSNGISIDDNKNNSNPDLLRSLLPWSHGQSDAEIKVLRTKIMNDDDKLWNQISTSNSSSSPSTKKRSRSSSTSNNNNNSVANHVLKDYFACIRKLEYADKPDYEELKKFLIHLNVEISNIGDSNGRITSSSDVSKTTKNEKVPALTLNDDEEEDVLEEKKRKMVIKRSSTTTTTTTTKNKKTTKMMTKQTSVIEILEEEEEEEEKDIDDCDMHSAVEEISDDEYTEANSFVSCEPMEWEYSPSKPNDENKPSSNRMNQEKKETKGTTTKKPSKNATTSASTATTIELLYIDGPKAGQTINLENSISLGKNKEVKLTLQGRETLRTIRVQDMNVSDVLVGGKVIPKGKHKQAFLNDKIQVGDDVLQIVKKKYK